MATRTDILNWDQTSGVPWNLFGGTALTKLRPGLGDSISLCREEVSSSHVEDGCVLICANLAMKGFAVSQAMKAWWIRL